MNLHALLMELGQTHSRMNGKGFSDLITFDLKRRTIKNGNIVLMKDGVIIPQTIKVNGKELTLDDDLGFYSDEFFYDGLELRYHDYYTSPVNEHYKFSRENFIAKTYEELTQKELDYGVINGISRAVTRYELEWWVIANALTNRIKWNDSKWFWKSKKYPKLIIFKKDVKGI